MQLKTDHKVFNDLADELINAKIPDRQDRIKAIDELIEDYFKVLGEMPSGVVLHRLGNEILREELQDKRSNKVTAEEHPILSETQLIRRYSKEIPVRNVKGAKDQVIIGKQITSITGKNGEPLLLKQNVYNFSGIK